MTDVSVATDANLSRIEDRLDKDAAGTITVNGSGLALESMKDVMEFAKLMALSGQAVPPHLRAKPGMCLGVCVQALEWKMSPFAVANKSYVVNDRLAYESQLLHAVIEARAPLAKRLRCEYTGEGQDRHCVVFGTFKGEDEPHVYESPPLKNIKGKSPLWVSDPDQQLWYFAARAWARKWCPDVLMGIYTPDEAEQFEVGEHAKDVSPNLMERLPGRMSDDGFKPNVVETGLADPAPRPKKGRRKAEAEKATTLPDAAQTAPGEPLPQALPQGVVTVGWGSWGNTGATAGYLTEPTPPIPAPDTPSQNAESTPASPPSGTGAAMQPGMPVYKDGKFWGTVKSVVSADDYIPETAEEYTAYAEQWIPLAGTAFLAFKRWEKEADLRDTLTVPMQERFRLRASIQKLYPEKS